MSIENCCFKALHSSGVLLLRSENKMVATRVIIVKPIITWTLKD